MRRVVVTGLGAVTPVGQDIPSFWRRLCAGKRGVRRISRFDPTGLRNEKAGEIADWNFEAAAFGLSKEPDLATQFLLQATWEAWQDAGLGAGGGVGAVMSTNFGGSNSWEAFCAWLREWQEEGEAEALQAALRAAQAAFCEFAFQRALGHIREAFGLTGPLSLLSIACASGAAAIGYAWDLIRTGRASVILAGGHDALAPTPLSGLSTLHTITAEDIRPFSADRSGTLFGEGAGVLVLEELEHACARGARIYAEVLGAWQNNNAYHLTAPDPGGAGMRRVLQRALDAAGLAPEQLDYINAHGTGTKPHDAAETEAIKAVLGAHAYEIPVSSIKGAIAHLMGAAGAVEAIATVKTIETGIVPPTVNYRAPDPECDLNVVPNEAQEACVRYAATISAGIGGSNACVVFGPPPEECGRGGATTQLQAGHTAKIAGQEPQASGGSRTSTRAGGRSLSVAAVADEHAGKTASEKRVVVITGIAPISAIGIGGEDFARGLAEGREGRRAPERLREGHPWPLLAECLDFVVEDYLESEKTYLDRCSELTLAACALAWREAGLNWRELPRERIGLALGTAYGCLDSMHNMTDRVQRKGVRFGAPVIFTHSFANTPASLAAVEYEIQGAAPTFCVGDLSAGSALDYAWRIIAQGQADVMLVGGVEALSIPLLVGLADYALRDGAEWEASFVPGEGASIFVLEEMGQAARRGARIFGEILFCRLEETNILEDGVDVDGRKRPVLAAKKELGHTFGACLALDLATALLSEGPEEFVVARRDPLSGSTALIAVRRWA